MSGAGIIYEILRDRVIVLNHKVSLYLSEKTAV
jgi:hypothetical protein